VQPSAVESYRYLVARFVRRHWATLVCGSVLEFGFLAFFQFTQSGNWSTLPILFFLLFSIYALTVLWTRKKLSTGRAALCLVLLFAIAFRLTLLFSGPVFSYDMYRYVWDGKVSANGINPYLYPPDAPQLSSLRDSNWELVNQKNVRTAYPPLMEMLFTFLYVLTKSAVDYKLTFLLFDLATVGVIFRILATLGLDSRNLILYAWAPLPIVEISQTGHNDSVAIFLVLLSLLLLLQGRKYSSAAAMSMAVLAKIYPIFFAPILFRQWGKRGCAIFLILLVAFHIPYVGFNLLNIYSGGLLYVINASYFNGSIFPLLLNLVRWGNVSSDPTLIVQLSTYAIYGIFMIWALSRSLREKRAGELVKLSFLLTGALLLLSRSLFPWYMSWILPFLTLYISPAWIFLSGSIFLSYFKYDSFPPPPYEAVTPQVAFAIDALQYLPFYALLVYEIVKNRISSRAPIHITRLCGRVTQRANRGH
jgi:alpha-1,6-mannosyltransferase